MTSERRRYFRINETLGVSYSLVDSADSNQPESGSGSQDIFELVSAQDEMIEKLLIEVADESPKVAELVTVFNQKLERIVGQLVMDSRLIDQIAFKVREVNISACGIGFLNDQDLRKGTRLKLELELYPGDERVQTYGILVGSSKMDQPNSYYWRIEFYGMRKSEQETLIQHIVKMQSAQLRRSKETPKS